jgi:hypothetical protein
VQKFRGGRIGRDGRSNIRPEELALAAERGEHRRDFVRRKRKFRPCEHGRVFLEYAQQMAAHESARTTKLYDRRNDQVTLDQVERIVL